MTYDELRKSRCELCAKGFARLESYEAAGQLGPCHNIGCHISGGRLYERCTAPSPEAAYEEASRALAAVRVKIEAALHGNRCASHQIIVGVCREVYFEGTDKPCNCWKREALALCDGPMGREDIGGDPALDKYSYKSDARVRVAQIPSGNPKE